MLVRSAVSDPRGKSVTKHEASCYATEPQISEMDLYEERRTIWPNPWRIRSYLQFVHAGQRSRETRDFGSLWEYTC